MKDSESKENEKMAKDVADLETKIEDLEKHLEDLELQSHQVVNSDPWEYTQTFFISSTIIACITCAVKAYGRFMIIQKQMSNDYLMNANKNRE